jgi:hypothetical protein
MKTGTVAAIDDGLRSAAVQPIAEPVPVFLFVNFDPGLPAVGRPFSANP